MKISNLKFGGLLFTIMAVAWLLPSCKSKKPITKANQSPGMVNTARELIGSSYRYGARGPKSFDCSGLIEYVFKRNGQVLKGSAEYMSRRGKGIAIEKARPGDLVFFKNVKKTDHVAIISRRKPNQLWVIHSTSSKGVIEEEILTSVYWKDKVSKVIPLENLTR